MLNYEFNGSSSDGYTISVSSVESRLIIIDVKPSTTYTLSWGDLTNYHTGHIRVGEFKEKTIGSVSISQFATNISNSFKTFTTTIQTNFIAIRVKDGVEILDNEQSLMLVEGSEKTSYEPYKSNILTVNEDVTLRSNGSVCDELDLLTGKLTQRIDEDGEILTQEVVKTVDLTIHDKEHQKVERLTTFKGGTHFITSSQDVSLLPTLVVEVVTDLEETLMVCSLEGNTM